MQLHLSQSTCWKKANFDFGFKYKQCAFFKSFRAFLELISLERKRLRSLFNLMSSMISSRALSTSPEREAWASDIRSAAARDGIESALLTNAEKAAQCALDYPHDFERFAAEWMHQDPETRKLMPSAPEGADVTKLSFQEARALRGKTDISWPASSETETEAEARSVIGEAGEVRDQERIEFGIPSSPVKGVVESSGKAVAVHRGDRLRSWGKTVEARPEHAFAPESVVGAQNIARFAKREGLRARVAASRHSWSSAFGKSGEALIALAPKKFAEGGGLHLAIRRILSSRP